MEDVEVSRMDDTDLLDSYRERIVAWITGAACLFILPFALNNLCNERWLVGLTSLFVLAVLISNLVAIKRGTKPWLSMLALLPAITAFLAICFLRQGIVAVFWSYPAVILFYFLLPPRQARIANATLLALVIPASCHILNPSLAARVAATLLGVSVLSGIFLHLIWLQQQELRRCAVTDPLTQVYNRLQLDHYLRQAQARTTRYQFAHTLLALDIDHFKSINDQHGHAAGDEVLRRLSQILRERTRESDLVFRTGGEEFLILLENTRLDEGASVAEQIRALIESSLLCSRTVTVSVGVAELAATESVENWLQRADQRLYQAKAAGRNRVVSGAKLQSLSVRSLS